jgi:hypothetical protein
MHSPHDEWKLFVLVRAGARVIVAGAPAPPESFRYEGRRYESVAAYLGDFDHLINGQNELAGFNLGGFDIFYKGLEASRLIRETTNARIADGALQFVFTTDEELENDCCQAIGPWLYTDFRNDHIIVLPKVTEWGKLWERIAFPIVRPNEIGLEAVISPDADV